MNILRLITLTFMGICVSSSASAGLILTLSNNGSGGTIATFQGSGRTSGAVGSVVSVGQNIGNFVDNSGPNLDHFNLASALAFTPSISITRLFIDRDFFSLDDFHFDLDGFLGGGVTYDINASSLVTGLLFSDLIQGTFNGTGRESRRLRGFKLVVANQVPEPGILLLFGGGLALLGFHRKVQRTG